MELNYKVHKNIRVYIGFKDFHLIGIGVAMIRIKCTYLFLPSKVWMPNRHSRYQRGLDEQILLYACPKHNSILIGVGNSKMVDGGRIGCRRRWLTEPGFSSYTCKYGGEGLLLAKACRDPTLSLNIFSFFSTSRLFTMTSSSRVLEDYWVFWGSPSLSNEELWLEKISQSFLVSFLGVYVIVELIAF
jgi:hypothetical protein